MDNSRVDVETSSAACERHHTKTSNPCGALLQNELVHRTALLVNVSTLLAGLLTPRRGATEVGGERPAKLFISGAAVSAPPLRVRMVPRRAGACC